jgi:hypothetical protein
VRLPGDCLNGQGLGEVWRVFPGTTALSMPDFRVLNPELCKIGLAVASLGL